MHSDVTPPHTHRYNIAITKKEFEAVPPDNESYKLVEYAFIICPCGDVKKVKVKLEN